MKGEGARDLKLNIYHVTYYCIYKKVKIGEILQPSKYPKIAADIRTSEHGLKSLNKGCYFRVL